MRRRQGEGEILKGLVAFIGGSFGRPSAEEKR